MLRARIPRLKPVVAAASVLLVLLAASEAGLRLWDSWQRDAAPASGAERRLTAPCWVMHHRLKPLKAQKRPQPDTGLPVLVRTNSFGLRGPDVVVPKPPGVYRIVCLGDESVFAAEVPEQDTFCRHLERRLADHLQQHFAGRAPRRVEVVNAGVPGYCPLLSYLQVRHSILGLDPDLLVLHFDMSDVADDHRYRRDVRMATDGTPMACSAAALDQRRAEQASGWNRLMTVRTLKRQFGLLTDSRDRAEDADDIDAPVGRYAWLRDDPPDWSTYVEQACSAVDHLAESARRSGSDFLVVAVPAPWQVSARASNGPGVRASAGVPVDAHYTSNRPFEQLHEHLSEQDIELVNVAAAFRSAPEPAGLYLGNAPRLSAVGHALYARLLADVLIARLPAFQPTNTTARLAR